jgi:putative ABC transport system permease protein
VAAFLLNVVVTRLVSTQREQIAALKALAYSNRSVAAHYLKLVGVPSCCWVMVLGLWAGPGAGQSAGRAVCRVLPFPGRSACASRRRWWW